MSLTPTQASALKALLSWLWDKAPGCVLASLVGFGSVWVLAQQTFATTQDMEGRFEKIIRRLDVSDADNRVRDLQTQVRQKEREISDLDMILTDMPAGEAASTLQDRVFELQQDLGELKASLSIEITRLTAARAIYEGGAP